MKASKSRRCHNLEPGRIPWRKFSRQARFSCYLHRAPDKIHMWKLSAWGKISSHGKIKGRRISMVKKKERMPFYQEKKKTLGESDWYWRSPDFEQRSRVINKNCHT